MNKQCIRSALLGSLLLISSFSADAAPPDLSGPWEIDASTTALKTSEGNAPALTSNGQRFYQSNLKSPDTDPIRDCLPPGIPRALTQKGYPFSIVVGKNLIGVLIQWNHLSRVIYMRPDHFENIGPEYLGQSIGHWEGAVLVVDTSGYNDKTWLDDSGLPHTEALHTIERIRLKGPDLLEDRIWFTDDQTFTQPWSTTLYFHRHPGVIVKEDYCLGRLGLGTTVSR
jgi:hypothetical protein